jgi:hypothetical protein
MDERRFQPRQLTSKIEVYRVIEPIAIPVVGSSMHCDLKNEVITVVDSSVWVPDTRPGTQDSESLPHVLSVLTPEFVRANCPKIFQRLK